MAKVTSKLQVTLPKLIAERFAIRPGDEITWSTTASDIRIAPHRSHNQPTTAERLAAFDAATQRQRQRQGLRKGMPVDQGGRDWTREELYEERTRWPRS